MNERFLPKSINRITMIRLSENGTGSLEEVYCRPRKRRRSRKLSLKGAEKAVRKVIRANRTFATQIAKRHDRNRTKKGLNWLVKTGPGVLKAGEKALQRL